MEPELAVSSKAEPSLKPVSEELDGAANDIGTASSAHIDSLSPADQPADSTPPAATHAKPAAAQPEILAAGNTATDVAQPSDADTAAPKADPEALLSVPSQQAIVQHALDPAAAPAVSSAPAQDLAAAPSTQTMNTGPPPSAGAGAAVESSPPPRASAGLQQEAALPSVGPAGSSIDSAAVSSAAGLLEPAEQPQLAVNPAHAAAEAVRAPSPRLPALPQSTQASHIRDAWQLSQRQSSVALAKSALLEV